MKNRGRLSFIDRRGGWVGREVEMETRRGNLIFKKFKLGLK